MDRSQPLPLRARTGTWVVAAQRSGMHIRNIAVDSAWDPCSQPRFRAIVDISVFRLFLPRYGRGKRNVFWMPPSADAASKHGGPTSQVEVKDGSVIQNSNTHLAPDKKLFSEPVLVLPRKD